MAHANGRIFIDTNTTPHRGVEIADLQQVLGRGTGDLGLLCSDKTWDKEQTPWVLVDANRIKKWAKWKPIVHTALTGMTSAVRKNANQGFAVSGSSSFIFSESDGTNTFASARDNGQDWTYIKPTGGIGVAPFRLLDFSNEDSPSSYGYNHNAIRFVTIDDVISDPTDENLDVKVRVDFYYHPADISFGDFAVIENMATQYDAAWYWCLFAKAPQQSSPSILPLYTDQTYATKMVVGSASSAIKRGFTHLTVSATASGDVEAYLGLVCLSNQTSGVIGCLYAPTEAPATFELKNTSTALRAGFLPMVGGMTGMQVSWAEATVNTVTAFSSSLQVLFLGYQSLTHDWTITVTERIYGKLNGSYQGYRERVNPITVNSTTGGGAVNGQWREFSPLNNEDVDDLGYSLKLQFGQETPIYFYYDGSAGMQMSTTEVISRIGDIKGLNDLGSYTYVQITKIN